MLDRLRTAAESPWIFAARKTCTKGEADGYPNACRTRRKNTSAGGDLGDTTQQREVCSLKPAGGQRGTIQHFRRPVDREFDRRASQAGFRTAKNAGVPEVRGRQRAAPNRQRGGRDQYNRGNDWSVEKHHSPTDTSIRQSQRPRGGTGGQYRATHARRVELSGR